MTSTWRHVTNGAALLVVLALIAFLTRNSIILTSVDTAHHLVLIDEIARHHAVLAADASRLGVMWSYPPAAHWIAALLAPIAGSIFVAMTWAAIAAVFLCYAMLFWLAQKDIGVGGAGLFAFVLICTFPLRSLIGWEIIENCFYPQLVAHVFALGFLCSLASSPELDRVLPATIPLVGAVLMYVQPLVAIQTMGFGLCFMLTILVQKSTSSRELQLRGLIPIAIASILSIAAIITSRAFWFMRDVADNNGGLGFGFSNISFVIIPAAIISAMLLWLFLSDRGSRTDGVLGSALAAATILILIQGAALFLRSIGSPYVVKKHLFIITTLAAVGLARLVSRLLPEQLRVGSSLISFTAGAAFAAWITISTLVPAETVLAPLRYAKDAMARLNVVPATIASVDSAIPPLANVIVSFLGFEHPHDGRVYLSYYSGNDGTDLADLLMVRHTKDIDDNCPDQLAPSEEFVIVRAECLRQYKLGTTLSFDAKGNASGHFVHSQWSLAEDWGRWAIGNNGSSVVLLTHRDAGDLTITAVALALTRPGQDRIIHVKCNGMKIADWLISKSFEAVSYSATIPASLAESGRLELSFIPDETIVPSGVDGRQLGIGLKSLVINNAR